jgi:imidazole glycerol-phosphate synthase subunit HisF
MLNVRIIPVLTLKDGRIIKTIKFDKYRDVGDPVTNGKIYESQDVDELVFLDITATQENREIHYDIVESFAKECSMPLSVGGGIKSVKHIRKLLQIAADKVVINSEAVRRPEFIKEAADIFGSQCIIVSIDAKLVSPKKYEVYINGGDEKTGLNPVDWAKKVEQLGAGEIFLTSIDRDGTMEGYDIELIKSVSDSVSIPVIACGGVGTLKDLVDGVKLGHASAIACSSIFNFTDNKPIKAKTFVRDAGVEVRPI